MAEDRKRTPMKKGDAVTLILLDANAALPPFDKVTSVAVVPFDARGNIVTALLERGPDLPGGHMQEEEMSFDATARREAMEEAFVILGRLEPACVIQSDYYGGLPEQLTYMVVLTGRVESFLPVVPDGETSGREILAPAAFIEAYAAGDKDFMRRIIARAQVACPQPLSSPPKLGN